MLGVGEFLPVDEGLAVALGDGMARAAVTVRSSSLWLRLAS